MIAFWIVWVTVRRFDILGIRVVTIARCRSRQGLDQNPKLGDFVRANSPPLRAKTAPRVRRRTLNHNWGILHHSWRTPGPAKLAGEVCSDVRSCNGLNNARGPWKTPVARFIT